MKFILDTLTKENGVTPVTWRNCQYFFRCSKDKKRPTQTRAWWQEQKAVMDQNTRDIRAYNKIHFEADSETMGTTSQIVHGLFKKRALCPF